MARPGMHAPLYERAVLRHLVCRMPPLYKAGEHHRHGLAVWQAETLLVPTIGSLDRCCTLR